jgi:multiple sugar transport system permease protein
VRGPWIGQRHGTTRVVRGRALRPGRIARVVFIVFYLCFLLLPLYWVAVTSIKPQDDLLTDPPTWWPSNPTGLHYSTALNAFRGRDGLENSLIIASCATVLAILIGTSAAYSMARFRTGGKHLAFWFLSQRIMPPIAIIIPVFLLFARYTNEWFGFSLVDTHLGLILLYTVFALPFTVWMMFAYFRQMPAELEEAALVDGCSRLQALAKVAWPLAAPGIVSAAAFAFILSWTEFIFALVLTRTHTVTLPVALAGIITGFQGNQYGEASALTMVSLIPALLIGIIIQRHLVRGLTLGAVQG